jgi:prepilin-type N-terminal cleavage/methylation domain-containing protein
VITLKKTVGFTLLELVLTVTILGILAISVIPKFLSFTYEATLSQSKALASSLSQAVYFTQIQWRINGHTSAVIDLDNYAGNEIDTNDIGFPTATNRPNINAIPNYIGPNKRGCNDIWNALLQDPPTVSDKIQDNPDFLSFRHNKYDHRLSACSYINQSYGSTNDRETSAIVIVYESQDGTVEVIEN